MTRSSFLLKSFFSLETFPISNNSLLTISLTHSYHFLSKEDTCKLTPIREKHPPYCKLSRFLFLHHYISTKTSPPTLVIHYVLLLLINLFVSNIFPTFVQQLIRKYYIIRSNSLHGYFSYQQANPKFSFYLQHSLQRQLSK